MYTEQLGSRSDTFFSYSPYGYYCPENQTPISITQKPFSHRSTWVLNRDFGDGLNLGGSGARRLVCCSLCQSALQIAMCRLELSYRWFFGLCFFFPLCFSGLFFSRTLVSVRSAFPELLDALERLIDSCRSLAIISALPRNAHKSGGSQSDRFLAYAVCINMSLFLFRPLGASGWYSSRRIGIWYEVEYLCLFFSCLMNKCFLTLIL